MRQHASRGFTLIEILVAMVIFAIMSVLAYRGLTTALQARERTEQENRKWRELAQFFGRLDSDFGAIESRPIRNTFGQPLDALVGTVDRLLETDAILSFTRAGLAGNVGALSTPQRLGYRLRDNAVELVLWPVLDQAPRTVPEKYKLLESVSEFGVRYLDWNNQWRDSWPINGAPPGVVLPRAVEVAVTLASGEKLSRLYALPEG